MKKSKIKRFVGRVLEFPGAATALFIYTGFAVFGKTGGAFGAKLKDGLNNAIPTIASVFWPLALIVGLVIWLT